MLDRLVYKQILQQLKEKNVNLNEYQLLHMYQLADANRLSTFFRVDEESNDVFSQIESLAATYLGVTQQYFTDTNQNINKIKSCMSSDRGSLQFA